MQRRRKFDELRCVACMLEKIVSRQTNMMHLTNREQECECVNNKMKREQKLRAGKVRDRAYYIYLCVCVL